MQYYLLSTNIDNERINGSQEENKIVAVLKIQYVQLRFMTQINGTQSDTNYSLSSPREPSFGKYWIPMFSRQ